MTKVKICGLTREEDVCFVNEALPDYVGFVFAESKRQIDFDLAKRLKDRLSRNIKAVGVFVNADIDLVKKLCAENIIDMIQLHGDEEEKYIEQIRKITDKPIIKAMRVCRKEDIADTAANFTLFDTYHKEQYGGTGESFNWQFVKDYEKPCFLAGGLDIGNIKEAIETVKPYCVDISSGVETDGVKDKEKIINIINLVRSVTDRKSVV